MTRIVKAELMRFARRRTMMFAGLGALAYALLATFTVINGAKATGVASRQSGTTLAMLSGHGGGTQAFAVGASFALGVGFAWAGPFENIVSRSWGTGYRIFPGQVLDSLIRGGTIELGMARAVITAMIYAAVAGAVALTLVSRRDVTA